MSVAGTVAITELWAKCKAWFGRKLGASTTATTASIQLQNNAGDSLGSAATIPAATTTAAGVMTADDKTKLNGIATGATANAATTTTPKMDGTAAVGSETAYAKGDHVHPTDTSRAPLASPTFTGTPKAPTAAAGTSTTQIATTAFVQSAIGASANDFTSPTESAAGTHGLVPAPPALGTGAGAQLLTAKGWYKTNGVAVSTYDTTVGILEDFGDYTLTEVQIPAATQSKAGVMTKSDKTKLDGIATGAEVNQNAFAKVAVSGVTVEADAKSDTLTLSAGSNITLSANASTDTVTISASGWPIYDDFDGATASAAGEHGLVPQPLAGDQAKFLRGSGDWEALPVLSDDTAGILPAIGDMSAFDEVSFLKVIWDGESPSFEWEAIEAGDVPSLPASRITSGTFDAARIPSLSASKIGSGTLGVARGGTGVSTLGAGVVYHSASGTGALSIATAANLVSAIGTSAVARATADASGNTITSTYATKSELEAAQVGAATFKGTLVASGGNGTTTWTEAQVEAAAYKKGWYWVCQTAGTYTGKVLEVGDMLFCVKDKSGTTYAASDFTAVQNNLVEMTAEEVDAICV